MALPIDLFSLYIKCVRELAFLSHLALSGISNDDHNLTSVLLLKLECILYTHV